MEKTNITSAEQPPLLPQRHDQLDLFICDIVDAAIKSDIASMEHPVFTLSKNPVRETKQYRNGDAVLEISPSAKGIANIYDKDILIFAISQIMAAKNAGQPYSRSISFNAKDYLLFTNRHTGGHDYELLKDSLDRLDGTRIRTTIKTGGEEVWEAFGLIEGAKIRRQTTDGKIVEWGVTLSEWLFNAIKADEVLTLHPDYFRLRKPIERRIYEIARKHCGRQKSWKINLGLLQDKCGSRDAKRNFRAALKKISEFDHLPDYRIEVDRSDMVHFFLKDAGETLLAAPARSLELHLGPETFDAARKAAPGWDVRAIEQEWRAWVNDNVEQGMDPPRNADKAFIGFCRKWFERRGAP